MWFFRTAILVLLIAALFMLIAAFGGHMLVVEDPLPPRADAVVVMEGSYAANVVRFAEGVRLLRLGRADNMVVKVGTIAVWGEWLPDVARRFIDREYGEDIARRIIICEGLADSTLEEAKMLQNCLRSEWESLIVVTSNFHTRRTKFVWTAELARRFPHTSLAVVGVLDGSFEPQGWWRRRRDAKTWLFETTKFGWYFLESIAQ